MQEIKSSCLSDIDVKLSSINVLFSQINQMMSSSPVTADESKLLLPRVNFILSEIKCLVSLSQDCCSDVSNFDGWGLENNDPVMIKVRMMK